MLLFFKMLRVVTLKCLGKHMFMFESLWYMGSFVRLLTVNCLIRHDSIVDNNVFWGVFLGPRPANIPV